MDVVYVIHDGATVRREGERLQVYVRRRAREQIQIAGLRQLVLVGNVVLTPGALSLVVRRGVDTVFLTHGGKYIGRVVGDVSSNVSLRLAQYRALTDPERTRALARTIVAGKIENQRALLLQHGRRHGVSPDLTLAERALRASVARLELAEDLDQIRGCEGAAAAAYFRAFGGLLRAPGFHFDTRNRRPPQDPVNALLSLGYTLLLNVVEAAVQVVGLDPHLGALHAPLAGRPSLVCDLVEEHRVPAVDALVVAAINKGAFRPGDFEEGAPGEPVLLPRETVRWMVTLFERRMQRTSVYGARGHRLTYRAIVEQQVRVLARHLLRDEPYAPHALR